ncbi:S-layer homology domain-containing protein [Bengtsoniella intestinalis]|uniref:S-layer homology domain-containing protein n=1 Tax=Bengtsoniella intestinalis TaxID=3073143 RepID=UPI00391EE3AB
MKKFLSLALALVMTMSLVTISASAATFTDDTDIAYSEAVEVMYAMDIISGYTDGTFDPTATLTRGAACKIICNLILGPTTAGALGADTAPYPDVAADHVFAGYIAYCANQGIVSGYADGTFNPAGEVTGVQFMKMLLGALGYDSTQEGFTGSNWSVNVQKLALAIGLDDGDDDYDGFVSMTREEACLYALNTMTATMVEYGSTTNLTIGDDVALSITGKYSEVTNTLSNDYRGTSDGDLLMQFCEMYFSKLELDIDDDLDAFGRPVSTWYYKNDKIGSFVNTDMLIASYENGVTRDTMYDLVGKDYVKDEDKTMTVYEDGLVMADEITEQTDKEDYAYNGSSSNSSSSNNGTTTEVFEDNDGNITIVTIKPYLMQAAADYSATSETLKVSFVNEETGKLQSVNSTTLSVDDFDVEDYVEDDYIIVTLSWDSGSKYDIESVTPAEVVTGEVTKYTENSNVYLDGVKYTYSTGIDTDETDGKGVAYEIGEDATVVLDTMGKIIFVDEVIVAYKNYVYIEAFDTTSTFSNASLIAAAYFADGTYEEITVKTDAGAFDDKDADDVVDADGVSSYDGMWYTYSQNSTGYYTLKDFDNTVYNREDADVDIDVSDDATEEVLEGAVVEFASGNTGLYANDSTVVLVKDTDDDIYVYTGIENLPTITATATADTTATVRVVEKTSTSFVTFAFVDLSNCDSESIKDNSTSVSEYVMLAYKTSNFTYEEGTKYYVWEAIVDGELVEELYVSEDIDELEEGYLYRDAKVNSEEYISDMELVEDDDNYHDVYSYEEDGASVTSTISYSGSVLNFGKLAYYVSSSVPVNLMIAGNGDCDVVMSDVDADYGYEFDMTASALTAMFKGYTVTADWYVVTTDDGNSVASEIYVFVTAVEETDDEEDEDIVYADVVNSNNDTSWKVSLTGETGSWKTSLDEVEAGENVYVRYDGSRWTSYSYDGLTLVASVDPGAGVAAVYVFEMPEEDVDLADFVTETIYEGVTITVTGGNDMITVAVDGDSTDGADNDGVAYTGSITLERTEGTKNVTISGTVGNSSGIVALNETQYIVSGTVTVNGKDCTIDPVSKTTT